MDFLKLSAKKCTPCTNKTPSLNEAQKQSFLNLLPGWKIQNGKLQIEIKTKNFAESLLLAHNIGKIAEEQNHHPDLHISWGLLKISIFTHAINNLSENDFILAAKLDELL